jgi:hypothetical protein
MPSYTEEDVTNALNALVNGEYRSIRQAALAFGILSSTLHNRRRKPKSRKESYVSQQILSPIEESTLENWIYRAAKLGALITLQLVKTLALEIQSERSSNNNENESNFILDRWINRFRARHPRIKTCFSRTIDIARSTALDFSTIKSYFNNLGELLREHRYPLVQSITLMKPAFRSDLVGNQLFYLISEINAEKRNNQDDKSGLPV